MVDRKHAVDRRVIPVLDSLGNILHTREKILFLPKLHPGDEILWIVRNKHTRPSMGK